MRDLGGRGRWYAPWRAGNDGDQVRSAYIAQKQQYLDDEVGDLGIAFSGGGVRSAIFHLGVLQELQRSGRLAQADHLAAVSGGCYIAAAYWITAGRSPAGVFDEIPPWAPGSPEESHFRQRMDYLAAGAKGWAWMALNVLYGVLFNYLPIMIAFGLIGRVAGWVYVEFHLVDANGVDGTTTPPLTPTQLMAIASLFLVVGLIAVGGRRFAERVITLDDRSQSAERWVTYACVTFVTVLVVGVTGPAAIAGYRRFLGAVSGDPDALASSSALKLRIVGVLSFLGILLAITSLGAALVRVRPLRGVAQLVSGIAGAALLALPATAGAEASSRLGLNDRGDIVESALIVLSLFLIGIAVHNGRYSLHLFYKERLQEAFAVRRLSKGGAAVPILWGDPILMTDVCAEARRRKDLALPNLIICASVTMRDREVSPRGRWAEAFAFTEDRCGGPVIGYRGMHEYENSPGKVELTLPALMAISGAALSPTMGRFTKWQHRFTLALLNARLGVWLPNPEHPYAGKLRELRETVDDRSSFRDSVDRGSLVERCTRWTRDRWSNRDRRRNNRTETRVEALWRMIVNLDRFAPIARLKMGWYEPGALYVLREARGWGRRDARYVHVADGGHLENLGLLELLRRRCRVIMCFDASGTTNPLLGELGVSLALAKSDLGVDIELEPTAVDAIDDIDRITPIITGTIRYPDGSTGTLILARSCVSRTAPFDVRSFARRDRRFPHHGLRSQLYSDDRFAAYRSLGVHVAEQANSQLEVMRLI